MKLKLKINKVVFTTTILPSDITHKDLRYYGVTEERENWTVLIREPKQEFNRLCLGTVMEFKIEGFSNRGGDVKHASGSVCQEGEVPRGESPIDK